MCDDSRWCVILPRSLGLLTIETRLFEFKALIGENGSGIRNNPRFLERTCLSLAPTNNNGFSEDVIWDDYINYFIHAMATPSYPNAGPASQPSSVKLTGQNMAAHVEGEGHKRQRTAKEQTYYTMFEGCELDMVPKPDLR